MEQSKILTKEEMVTLKTLSEYWDEVSESGYSSTNSYILRRELMELQHHLPPSKILAILSEYAKNH